MEKILEINNLNKTFNSYVAGETSFSLKDISFSLEPGYIMGFIGPNGSGKSTLIKLIMNLIRKDSGQIKIFGKDHVQHEVEIKEKIGFVYDENHFYENLSIHDMTRIIAPFYKNWDQLAYQAYMKKFELPIHREINKLSKGMKMKYALAIALSHQAQFIIMDEPSAGLDPIFRSELLDILYEIIQDEQKSILFSTHITRDLDKIADYITFVHEGSLVFSKEKDKLLDTYTIIKGDKSLLSQELRNKMIGMKEHDFSFEALVLDQGMAKDLQEGILYERPTIEDIMVYMVRGLKNV